jgi:cell division protein FtsZ
VPSPVSFVSPDGDEDEDYDGKTAGGYGTRAGDDRDRDRDAASAGSAGWRDSGRPAKQDTVFDVSAGRRRPVVFEEDDDLDVPDFLK